MLSVRDALALFLVHTDSLGFPTRYSISIPRVSISEDERRFIVISWLAKPIHACPEIKEAEIEPF